VIIGFGSPNADQAARVSTSRCQLQTNAQFMGFQTGVGDTTGDMAMKRAKLRLEIESPMITTSPRNK
jgi:hypothetical protein